MMHVQRLKADNCEPATLSEHHDLRARADQAIECYI
jgi:hypothetical protein